MGLGVSLGVKQVCASTLFMRRNLKNLEVEKKAQVFSEAGFNNSDDLEALALDYPLKRC